MAEPRQSIERGNDRDTGSGGVLGAVLLPFEMFGNAVKAVVDAVMRDGTIEAFGRQGIDELGTAFGKMLPDSIQVVESGTIWNPTPGEVQQGRDPERQERMNWASLRASRSAEAEQSTQQPEQDRGKEQDGGMSM
jgi:hypothetical protein